MMQRSSQSPSILRHSVRACSCTSARDLTLSLVTRRHSVMACRCASAQDLTLSPVTRQHSVRACCCASAQDLTLSPASSTFSKNMLLCLRSRPDSVNLVYHFPFVSVAFSYWRSCFCIKIHRHRFHVPWFPTLLLCILFTISRCQLSIKSFNHLSIVGICLPTLFYCLSRWLTVVPRF